MNTITNHIREHLERDVFPMPTLDELAESEWSPEFEKLMRNRMLMGSFRYERLHDKYPGKWATLESIKERIKRYERTHNLECLVDTANLCLIEFLYPSFNDATFAPEDDGEHARRTSEL